MTHQEIGKLRERQMWSALGAFAAAAYAVTVPDYDKFLTPGFAIGGVVAFFAGLWASNEARKEFSKAGN